MTWIPAANFTKGRIRPISLIVIHDMEAPQGANTAESVANWFHNQARNDSGTSATVCVDENSIVDCVRAEDTPWAAPNANSDGLHIEHAGYARNTAADWLNESNKAMLEISASRAAYWSIKYGIPVRRLTVAELRAGAKGFCGHLDVTNALNGGEGHTDPGPNFPWDYYLARVRVHVEAQSPSSSASEPVASGSSKVSAPAAPAWFKRTLKSGDKGADVSSAQKALNRHSKRTREVVATDGRFGPDTERAVKAFQQSYAKAWRKSRRLTVDGVIGRATAARLGKA